MLTHSISLQTLGLARVALSKNNYQKRLLALMSTKPEFIKLKNLTLLTELKFFGVIYLMNKKILGIIAVSVAALGSAIVAAPVHAQSANLPVELTIKPAVYLRTYKDLKLVVSRQDLLGGTSVDQTAGSYDESSGTPTPLSTSPVSGSPTTLVSKNIPILYQVWGGSSNTTVNITATQPTLTNTGSSGLGSADTVTMAVDSSSTGVKAVPQSGSPYYTGSADLKFTFNGGNVPSAGTTYKGGALTISVVNP